MLGHKRIPSREGGVEIVVEELATRMVAKGYCVTCFNRKGKNVTNGCKERRVVSYKGVEIKEAPTWDIKGLAAVTSSFFATLMATFGRYDVIHFHAEGPAFMCWLPKLLGKHVVVTIHGLDHMRAKWGWLASKYIMLGEKNAARYADEVIVLSKSVQRYFLKKYNRETILIPNGVKKPKLKAANIITEKYGLSKNEYILYLARLVPEKGLDYLIKAFKNVSTNKKLVIAGGSSDTNDYVNHLKQLAANDERIMFTGFVQGEILEELYSNAYVYTLPSDLEGMPLSLLEAMSYGNCCLTSDIEECKSVVGKYGILFPKGNVDELRRCLQKICNEYDCVKYYKSVAGNAVISRYNWDDIVDKTLALYGRR